MITIEGLSGKGSLWCTFTPPVPDNGSMPSVVRSLCSTTYLRITPFAPFECSLPPTMPEQISYPVGLSSFGPVASTVEVGSISSINTSPQIPHPCTHTTINGGLLYHGSGVSPAPSFTVASAPSSNYRYYTDNDQLVRFCYGKPSISSYPYAFDRFGEKVKYKPLSNNAPLWDEQALLLCDWQRQIGSSILPGDNPALQMQWRHRPLSSSHNWTTGPCRSHRHAGRHQSRGVFTEDIDMEYHTTQSYTPADSIGPFSGRGYTAAYASWHRSHRMVSIQALQDAHFRVLLETVTESYYGYWTKGTGYVTGTCPKTKSTTWITLLVMEPGLSVGGLLPVDLFNNYCWLAPLRARELFCSSDATLARTRAVSDVTGLDSNWIENLSQVKGTPPVISQLTDGRANLRAGNLEMARKSLAGAYLTYKYAIAPSISDYHDVTDNGGNVFRSFTKYRYSNERRRGRVHKTSPVLQTTADLDYFTTLHLQLKDSSFAEIWNALERLGLDPSANNLWDLIPMSFVVDWFASVGPALDTVSAYTNNTLVRDIKSRIETFKVQWPLTEEDLLSELLTDFSVTTPLVYNWYDRRIYAGLGSVDPFAGQSFDGLSVSQMAQGAALLSNYR